MRVPDDPALPSDEPEIDSPLATAHAGSFLRTLGIVLLIFGVCALPLIRPDLRSGHHFYVFIVAATLVVALLLLVLASILRRRAGS